MKIAVQLDDDRNIINANITNELGAELQVKLFANQGWTLAESDPAFSSAESYLWSVRESDNKLVHISTGMTPDEETKASLSELTKEQLKDSLTKEQLQMGLTSLTKEYIEDKANSKMVTTELTKQIAELTIKLDKVMGIDPTPKVPTDVTSTATNDGAIITAK
ncbi:hypothetical protein D1B17_08575 [Companilactobacillus zhachilii]|uniref:Uncharacterized protein n=1 Tax=Companilactobacillus zhachilii TaxID=2304606 RepID=A0A386PU88_9LACO|nr:hypothetical protein [Companilactobacillus zhachilii]AYE38678.1 hypothetical protein D1B17_08575 [Companilactobacillus zhachilii]